MRLAIADPPYPPKFQERRDLADGGTRLIRASRAVRWYGEGPDNEHATKADRHPAAAEWDDLVRHRDLLDRLVDEFDGWALATTPDGLGAYHPLPVSAQLLAWVKPRAMPTGARVGSGWEPVIIFVPEGRRRRIAGVRQLPDVLTCPAPAHGFTGSKPAEWTRWVLDALGYDPEEDTVDDLFPGSGAVQREVAQGVLL